MRAFVKDSYDVVVAGAGPGGSRTAMKLAELGHSVLLLEKRQEIGAPKRCAEGLTLTAVDIMGDIPPNCKMREIVGAKVYSPDGNSVIVHYGKQAGYCLERKQFDKWLACEASRAGATVLANSEVTDVIKEGGKVKGVKARICGEDEIEIRSSVVVAADGIESTISRKAGLDTTNSLVNVDSGFQYEMSNLHMEDPDNIMLYFGNDVAPRGYVWIFPKGKDVANVGIGTALSEKSAKHYLDRFIESHPEIFKDAGIVEVNSGGIPVGGFLRDMVLDGFLAVGDAAHQVNPIHGGGLKEASVAAEIAAKVIHRALMEGDVSHDSLSEYNDLWWKERGERLKKVEKLRQVTEKLSDKDLNMLAKSLTSDVLIGLTRGSKMGTLAKVLMKNPRLIGIARHLI